MPGAVFLLFVLTLILNPLLKLIHPRAGLNRGELLVVYIMMVMASPIPTLFVGKFLSAISYPYYYATPENEWRELIHPYIPDWLMVHNVDIVKKFYEGGGRNEPIPWAAWRPVFLAWLPFVWALFLVMISLMIVMRKQWVEHERLIYPLMRGMVWGCREAGCALIGGETAQLPGVYGNTDFDLAGFVVGAAERDKLLDGNGVVPGDRLIGIPSSGVHTNGFSLVRRVFNLEDDPAALFRSWPGLERNLGDELMVRHRAYYPSLEPYLGQVKALSHITGGGLPGKMPASLPAGVAAEFRLGSWPALPIFGAIQEAGNVSDDEMYRVFNMGLGMVAVCDDAGADAILAGIPDAVDVGQIVESTGEARTIFRDD